jgi:hypothetical protein
MTQTYIDTCWKSGGLVGGAGRATFQLAYITPDCPTRSYSSSTIIFTNRSSTTARMSRKLSNQNDQCDPMVEFALETYEALPKNFRAALYAQVPVPGFDRPLVISESRCPFFLIGGTYIIMRAFNLVDSPEEKEMWMSRHDQATIWAVAWVTEPRTSEQMQGLLDQRCYCEYLPHKYERTPEHKLGYDCMEQCRLTDSPGLQLVSFCLRAFQTILGTDPKLALRLELLSKRRRWPRTLNELLPHGPEATFNGLLHWMDVSPDIDFDCKIFQCIDIIFRVAHTIIAPIATRSPALAKHINSFMRRIFNEWSMSSKRPDEKQYLTAIRGLWLVSTVMESLYEYSPEPVVARFVTFEADDLLTSCANGYELALTAQKRGLDDASEELLSSMGIDKEVCTEIPARFARFAGRVLDATPGMLNDALYAGLPPRTRKDFDYYPLDTPTIPKPAADCWRLKRMFMFFNIDERCQRVGCQRTCADTGRPMRACSGCRRLRYCSRSCQKRAWTEPWVAHRDLCPAIAALCNHFFMPARTELVCQFEDLLGSRKELLKGKESLLHYTVTKLHHLQLQAWISI